MTRPRRQPITGGSDAGCPESSLELHDLRLALTLTLNLALHIETRKVNEGPGRWLGHCGASGTLLATVGTRKQV